MTQRTLIIETLNKAGKSVILKGWVDTKRDHGKITFIDLRDRTGKIQCVGIGQMSELTIESVVEIEGLVKERPANLVNPHQLTGSIEIEVKNYQILNKAVELPITLDTDGREIGEEPRLKHRYLDLRRERMQRIMRLRSQFLREIREALYKSDFVEIETPMLTKSTKEGARDFLVPSRFQPGKFYALPQSPQQYKQLLMTAGFERYFQVARCIRDEDLRADRGFEFTQLDLEMSFVKREDVMEINEKLLIDLVKTIYPEKEIQEIPFPRLSYKEAMEKYNSDRPDLRKDKDNPNLLAFCWVVDFPFFEKTDEGWTFTHNPFSAPKPEHAEDLISKKNIADILTTQYDVVLNGWEIGGGSIRNHKPEALEAVFEIMGFEKERIKENFGHMLEALGYGAPPHGGIAWGFDRLIALLRNEPNIREVISFPKTGDARDLMMSSPSELEKKQLKELHLKIEK